MPIRVIAGSAKGRRLKLVPGASTRPVMDRVKEACFSIIGRDIIEARFLDLFAGTGSVGIEALSRGAKHVVFVEIDRMAIKTIHENLAITKFTEQAVVRRVDVFSFLAHPPLGAFDFVYVAPPQYKELWQRTLQALDAHPDWLSEQGRVIVQIDPSERADIELIHLIEADRRMYGKTMLLFYEPTGDADESEE